MNPARWPNEPLIERLAIDELDEVQAYDMQGKRIA